MEIIKAVILGGIFGFALYYVGATVQSNISNMLRLEDLKLAKIIFFAIGFGSVLLSISALFGVFDLSHIKIKDMNLGVVIGGLLFGIGFGVSGRCPGTCVGAIGGMTGLKTAILTVLGGLFGAFTYALCYKTFAQHNLFNSVNYGKLTLFQVSDSNPSLFSIGFTGLLIVGILFMLGGYFMPTKLREAE